METRETGTRILAEAMGCWNAAAGFRRERRRNKNYTFGRQWEDTIMVKGVRMTEREYILSEGHLPLKNNLIRRIVRNVLGVFRRQLGEKMEGWSPAMKRVAADNDLYELYSRTMEEFLISGMAVHKKWTGVRGGKRGIWTDLVSPSGFFYDTSARDPRGADFTLLGQIHDVSFGDYCSAFASTPEEYSRAEAAFGGDSRRRMRVVEVWRRERRGRRLLHDAARGRVMLLEEEEWRRHPLAATARSRWVLHDVWRYYFIDETGRILRQGDSPYRHRSHPYVFKAYPFLDGEIHSFVGDTLDQQRYTNRLITMYDWIMRASAKGVLLLPEGCVDTEDLHDVAEQWSRFNGVIVYKPRAGMPDPKQVSGNAANIGIGELLNIQLKMLEDVSGVNGALQGNLQGGSVSGTLYSQQTENALTSLTDLLDTFASFIADCMEKDRQLAAL